MAIIQQTHTPILSSNAQVLILPVNNAGITLDSVLTRCRTLYPDNYQHYHRACRDGSLQVGSCLLHKRQRQQIGLGAAHNGNQPGYIANLVVSDHPYHPARERWLITALSDLQQQLIPLIRHQGVRKIALLARPLIFTSPPDSGGQAVTHLSSNPANNLPLDWSSVALPLLTKHLEDLPKVRIELHVPKNINIQ